MDDERPSPMAYTSITPPEDEPAPPETQAADALEESNSRRIPSNLVMLGFLGVIVLIVAGLFLPPVSLGQRLGFGSDDSDATLVIDQVEDSTIETAEATGGRVEEGKVETLSLEDFTTSDTWAVAAAALPEYVTPVGTVHLVEPYEDAATGQLTVDAPADVDSLDLIDLLGWDGQQWRFIPSEMDPITQQLVTPNHQLPQAVIMAYSNPLDALSIGAELLPTQSFPAELISHLTEVSVGTLTLTEGGGLLGEVTSLPTGSSDGFILVTNSGAFVDQGSLSSLLTDIAAQAEHNRLLLEQVLDRDYAGVNLDYQGVPRERRDAFTAFVDALATELRAQDRSLIVTLATPTQLDDSWDTAGQDWAALGQLADAIYVQMPLDPAAYDNGGRVERILSWATRKVSRHKLNMVLSASAVDRLGESFLELSNDQALTNFGELQFLQGSAEVDVTTPIEVALSGTASPLEWDGASLTYRYSYEMSGQTHHVWLGSPAALSHEMRFAHQYKLRGIAVRGLGALSDGSGYDAVLSSFLGTGEAPQPVGAAIVWTVRNEEGSVLASSSGDALSFSWDGTEEPGSYSINADFALGDNVAKLGSVQVAVDAPPEPEPIVAAEEEGEEVAEETGDEAAEAAETSATDTTPVVVTPGDADAVANVGANVRVGPGLTYGTITGGLRTGDLVSILGRNSDATWIHILMPDGERKGWVFAPLLNINQAIDVSALELIEVDPPVVAGGGDSGTTAPPPVTAPPVTNAGFALGGQTHTLANPALMSYAGMNWVKFQHKWSPGDAPDAVAGRIQQAHANGFKVLLSIPGTDHTNIDFNAYANFLGGVAALAPDAIEVWNEMNIDREWPAGQISPSSYVNNMLAPAYNAIKAARSSVMVISGAPAPTGFFGGCGGGGCNDDLYVAGMAAAGAANYMDCIGIHYNEGIISPNQTSGDPRNPSNHYTRYFWGMVNTYWNAFGGARPLCFTELGYLSGADYGGLPPGFTWAGNTSVAQHAQWLAEAASLSASSGKVRLLIVFNVDFTTYGADPQAGFAMIRADGSCPACETLRQVMGGN